MKKTLLTLAAAMCVASYAQAETVSVEFSKLSYENQADVTTVKANDQITLVFDKGTNNNAPKYYTTGTAVRLYGGNTLTVVGASGCDITKISFKTPTGNNAWNSESTSDPKGFTIDGGTATWEGSAPSVKFTQGGTTGHVRIQSVSVTYKEAVAPAVATPTISYVLNESNVAEVTLACATEGANLYYTLDGTDPTADSMSYNGSFPVNESCTVKAIAIKGTDSSRIATSEITIPVVYTSLASLLENATANDEITVKANMTVLYKNGAYLYLTDGVSNMLAYGYDKPYEVGANFNVLEGKVSIYNTLFEVTDYTLTAGGTGATYAQKTITDLSAITEADMFEYVKIEGATLTGSGSNFTIELNGKTFPLYDTFKLGNIQEGTNCTIEGFITINRSNLQLAVTSVTTGTVMENVATPEFNPASGELKAGDLIEITCATEGAVIRYTTDGTEPTEASELYTAPIVFAETMTVKAVAYAENMLPSAVAAAEYTLYDPDAPVATSATFNFATCKDITFNPAITLPTDEGQSADVSGCVLSNGNVSLSIAGKGSTVPRIWKQTATYNGNLQLRTYKGEELTITLAGNGRISKIEFDAKNWFIAVGENEPGTLTNKTWTPNEGEDVKTVKFVNTQSGNSQINSIVVTIDNTTAVEGVDVAEDAAPVYYNLQGVRVANPENGLYIVVRGNKVTKEVIR